MLVKKNGAYSFYDGENFVGSYEDADIITDDEMIAVCVDGLCRQKKLRGRYDDDKDRRME